MNLIKFQVILSVFVLMVICISCSPNIVMYVGEEVDNQRPRFALPERLFFYELEQASENLVLRIETIDIYTKEQLVNFPIIFFIANKNKRDVRFKMIYQEHLYFDTIQQNRENPTLKLNKITKLNEFDITDSIQLAVSSSSSQAYYALRIDFPKTLFDGLDQPVMGIVSEVNKEKYDIKYSTRPNRGENTKSVVPDKNNVVFENDAKEPILQQSYTIPSINIWFQLVI